MKKVLSVILAIMMLFGAMSISSSAVVANTKNVDFGTAVGGTTIDASKHVIIQLDFGNGKSLEGLYVYDVDNASFTRTDGVTGKFLMLPSAYYDLRPGQWVRLPAVSAPEGQTCQGWEIRNTGTVVGHGVDWEIPANSQGRVLELVARYTTAEAEEDTMSQVLGILMKVFGTIIGVLFLDGSAEAGIELMQKMLGGLIG